MPVSNVVEVPIALIRSVLRCELKSEDFGYGLASISAHVGASPAAINLKSVHVQTSCDRIF